MILQTPIGHLGYGRSGFEIAKQLINQLPPDCLTIYPIGNPEMDLYEKISSSDWRLKDKPAYGETIKIWHQHSLHEFVGNGEKIGFPIFELNKFTDVEKRSMRHCDRLFVCSEWAKNVVEEEVPKIKVSIVPLGVDRETFNELNNVNRPSTIFFNCGKWEVRKGHDLLLDAFNEAFDKNDNVELWMMCDNPFIGEDGNNDWKNRYSKSKMGSKIRFIPYQKTHRDVYNIIRQIDCGVFPARAEGWNLELLECQSCGKTVIATNYAGHSQFINESNAMLLDVDKIVPAEDGIWFFKQGEWAEPNKDQLVSNMKKVHAKKQNGSLSLNLEGVETAKKFSWVNTVETILSELHYV